MTKVFKEHIDTFWHRHCAEQNYSAFIIPTSDPHGSEYLPECWKVREWMTGFTGSAGLLVLSSCGHALWTDSRYWLQAAEQLEGTGVELMRDGAEGVPSPEEWLLVRHAEAGTTTGLSLGYVSQMMSVAQMHQFDALQKAGWSFKAEADPFDEFWTSRPQRPGALITRQPTAFTGEEAARKIGRIWTVLEKNPVPIQHYLLCDLSEIAWTLNLRGEDIPFNPVFLSYLLLHADGSATLFVNEGKLTSDVRTYLESLHVEVLPYESVEETLRHTEGSVGVGDECNMGVWKALCLRGNAEQNIIVPSPVAMMRAVKSDAEQEGFRRAMERDGVAMVRLLSKIDCAQAANGNTEMGIARILEQARAEQEHFCGLSFETISAYGPHGAIVHYEPTPQTDARLEARSFLLLDSGAQYEDGTTDITRTIPLGPLTDEERTVYTLVLKGHIELARLRFPEGTRGLELDLAARRAMWEQGYDFGHGTGHGVGSRLCVHEGPQQIRKNPRACTTDVPFLPGMTITDEPGIYVEGKFGVRIENVLLVVPDGQTPFGRFCRFETLTLCPIDLRPVRMELLSPEDVKWLNDYHAEVRRRLAPLLSGDERKWLEEHTQKI
ncbi:MAG: aminopeptidase P family protein [Alloprevotella sp.]|nr:aminopeptidase P family protein [Alloprevotella sp.]